MDFSESELLAMDYHLGRWLSRARSQEELFTWWGEALPILDGHRFIFSADFGSLQPLPRRYDFEGGAFLRSLFAGEKLTFLDDGVWRGLSHLAAVNIQIDYSVSFDTNAASIFAALIEGKQGPLVATAKRVLDYLVVNEVNFDFNLYYLENHDRILEEGLQNRGIQQNLWAIEVLKNLDEEHYRKTGEVRANVSNTVLDERLNETLEQQLRVEDDNESRKWLWRSFDLAYLALLKVVSLELRYGRRRDFDKKFKLLLEYLDKELRTMLLRELVIAIKLFSEGTKVPFFGPIQAPKDKLLKRIKNLAWDMQIFRQFERYTIGFSKNQRYFIPYLLTFDRPLANLWELYAIKALLIPSQRTALPFAEVNLHNLIREVSPGSEKLLRQYLTGQAVQKRRERWLESNSERDLRVIISQLETELLKLA